MMVVGYSGCYDVGWSGMLGGGEAGRCLCVMVCAWVSAYCGVLLYWL